MGRFTKRPVTIDAILAGEVLDGASSGRFSRKPENTNPIPDWVRDAFEQAVIGFESVGDPDPAKRSECVLINTLEGQMRAERTDWIIRGIKGELYPCKPDIFEATYDAGESPQQIPIIKVEGSIDAEQFAEFKRKWAAENAPGSRALIFDAETTKDDLLDLAWGLIANAGNGDWKTQTPEWVEAAQRWRDNYIKPAGDDSSQNAASTRDARQSQMLKWSIECFGHEEATSVSQRSLRLLEEAFELAQAAGVPRKLAHELMLFVYDRPPGVLSQEVGGVCVTLLVLCAAAGISADLEEKREIERVLAKSTSYFGERNAKKNEAGFRITSIGIVDKDKLIDPATTFKIVDQPPPKATELPAVWELVIADYRLRSEDLDAEVVRDVLDDMTARDATGRERYGVPLTAYNGRDQLVDAYQEQLDGAVYLRAAIEEGLNVHEIYAATLDSITQLRAFINGRKKS